MSSEYLSFEEDDHGTGKTKRIMVCSKRSLGIMGEIKWYGPWRQYCFYPYRDTVWNKDCLNDIVSYIGKLMDERKNKL